MHNIQSHSLLEIKSLYCTDLFKNLVIRLLRKHLRVFTFLEFRLLIRHHQYCSILGGVHGKFHSVAKNRGGYIVFDLEVFCGTKAILPPYLCHYLE